MEGHVFISYARADAWAVLPLAEELRARGITVWVDSRDIPAAARWSSEIVDAIGNASAVLLCLSKRAVASSHVRRELSVAGETSKAIVPIYLEPTVLPPDFLYYLTGIQAINLANEPPGAAVDRIIKVLHEAQAPIRKRLPAPSPTPATWPLARPRRSWLRVTAAFLVGLAIVVALLLHAAGYLDIRSPWSATQEPELRSNQVFKDRFIWLKPPPLLKGPFYNCSKYIISFEMGNEQSAPLVVPKIDFYFVNPEVQNRIRGFPEMLHGSFLHGTYENPGRGYWLPNEAQSVEMEAEFLPRSVHVYVYHSGTAQPSYFEVPLSREEDAEYWPGPRTVEKGNLESGIDGGAAYRQAATVAEGLLDAPRLSMAVPMKTATTKQGNGLDIVAISSWAFLFGEPTGQRGVWVNVGDGEPRGSVITPESDPEYREFLNYGSVRPIRVGTREAVATVSQAGMIYDNSCGSFWLDPRGVVDGEEHPVWKLPYVGDDYMTLFVDAFDGKVLDLDIDYQQTGKGPPWKYNIRR